MKLLFELREKTKHAYEAVSNGLPPIFCIEYDIGMENNYTKGYIAVTQEKIITIEDDEVFLIMPISSCSEVKAITVASSGFFEGKFDDIDYCLCRYSLTHAQRMGELAQGINYIIKNSEIPIINEEDEDQFCPKCGRRFIRKTRICPVCDKKMTGIDSFKPMLKPYLVPLIISAILFLTGSAIHIVSPYLSRLLIDDYIQPKNAVLSGFALIIGGMFLMMLLANTVSIIRSRMVTRIGASISSDLRCLLFNKIQEMSLKNFSKRTIGDLMRRVSRDTGTLRSLFCDYGPETLSQVVTCAVVFIIMMMMNWKLTLLAIIPVPVVAIVISKCSRFIKKRYSLQWQTYSKASGLLQDLLSGIRVVKSYGTEKQEIDRFMKATNVHKTVCADNETYWSLIFPPLGFLTACGEFLVLYFGGKLVLSETMNIGVLIQFSTYASFLYNPIRYFTFIPRWLADVNTSLGKINEIMKETEDIIDTDESIEMQISGTIKFDNVTFGYKSYTPILKDITVEIKQGEMIGIVGPSGVGKSTMINLIMRLYDVDNGTIYIDGVDIRKISQTCLREQTGVVLQETFLFAGTIYDNIRYAKPNATYEEVISASKIASCHNFIMKLPDAYNTYVGENGYTLSGGERQRVAIARAILHNPKILILDEATASLDTETEKTIQDALDKLIQNRTTIAIAHRLSTLKSANCLIVLQDGKIAEVGNHTELMTQKGVYYKLVMAQRQTSKIREVATA